MVDCWVPAPPSLAWLRYSGRGRLRSTKGPSHPHHLGNYRVLGAQAESGRGRRPSRSFSSQHHGHLLFLGSPQGPCICPASLPNSGPLSPPQPLDFHGPGLGGWVLETSHPGSMLWACLLGPHPSGRPSPLSVGDLTSPVLSPVSSLGSPDLYT